MLQYQMSLFSILVGSFQRHTEASVASQGSANRNTLVSDPVRVPAKHVNCSDLVAHSRAPVES